MIFDAIISYLAALAIWLLSLLPNINSSTLTSISTNWTSFKNTMATANAFVPVDTFFQVLGIMFVIESSLFLWHMFKWIGSIVSAGILKK